MDGGWSRKIQSRLFWSVKTHDQIVPTWWWSCKIWRLGSKVQGKVWWYFAMVNWSLDNFPGKRCKQYLHKHSTYRAAQHDHANTRGWSQYGSSASCIHLWTPWNSCHPRAMSRPWHSISTNSLSLSPSSPIFPLTSQTPTLQLVHHEHLVDDERSPCNGPRQSGGITPIPTTTKGRGPTKMFQYFLNSNSSQLFMYFWAIQGHSGGTLVDPTLQDNVLLPDDFAEYIDHIGNASRHALHHPVWMDYVRKISQTGQAISVFHSRETMFASQDLEEVQYDVDKPRTTVSKNTWRVHQGTVNWCNLKLAQKRGLQFCQTRSHAIAFVNTPPAICIEKVLYMKTGEDLYWKVHQSPRLPRVVLMPNLQHGRQVPSDPEAGKSTDHQRERNVKYKKTRRSPSEDTRRKHLERKVYLVKYTESWRRNVDCRIQGIPHSTVQKEDPNRKEIAERPIQQLENHPNWDSLIQNLNKTQEFNPFSEKSKEMITSIDNTENFELWETSSKRQCPDCAYIEKRTLYTAHAANACSLQKGIDRWTRKDSTSSQLLDTSSKRILPTVPDMDHLCGRPCTSKHMICWGTSAATTMVTVKPFWIDGTTMTNTASLCQTSGGLRNRSSNMMQSHWKTIPALLHGKKEVGRRNPGKFLWTLKAFGCHWISAVTFTEAKQKCKILYDEHTAITGDGNSSCQDPISTGKLVALFSR